MRLSCAWFGTNSNGPVRVFPGDGTGHFDLVASESAYSDYLAVGDVNGDGIPDIVSADEHAGVSIYIGNGDGTLQPAYSYPANAGFMWVGIATYSGSDQADLAVPLAGYGRRSLWSILGHPGSL